MTYFGSCLNSDPSSSSQFCWSLTNCPNPFTFLFSHVFSTNLAEQLCLNVKNWLDYWSNLFSVSVSMATDPSPQIPTRANSRRSNNLIHPVDVERPPVGTPNPIVYREIKHIKKWVPWLIPAFVVANTVMFIITMYVNNCPKNSVSCIADFLGRFSFQPFKENPLLGPSSAT